MCACVVFLKKCPKIEWIQASQLQYVPFCNAEWKEVYSFHSIASFNKAFQASVKGVLIVLETSHL